MICDNTILSGKVVIGANTILQPHCSLISSPNLSISIGENCVIEEKANIADSFLGHGNFIGVRANISKSSVNL